MKKTLFACGLWLALSATGVAAAPVAASDDATPESLRAAFITNLPGVTIWPVYHRDGSSKIKLCTFGDDAVAEALKRSLMSVLAEHMTLKTDIGEFDFPFCDIIYVSKVEFARFHQWRQKIKILPIVTVGEGRAFVTEGGLIAFTEPSTGVNASTNLSFRINDAEAEAIGIRFDAMLLELAEQTARPVSSGGKP